MEPAQSSTSKILAEKDSGVGWLIFNNPERRNAVDLDMWRAIAATLQDFEKDPSVRVVVMKGAGGKSFVSGGDISQYGEKRKDAEQAENYAKLVGDSRKHLDKLSKPLIAMIQGYCIGGGVAVAGSADIRIASSDAVFGITAAKLGIGYSFENTRKLVNLVGHAFAREMLLTARRFSAEEALRAGLVHRVVPADRLEDAVKQTAQEIAANAPLSLRATKIMLEELASAPDHADMTRVNASIRACFDSEDYATGRKAFLEKQKPVFVGR